MNDLASDIDRTAVFLSLYNLEQRRLYALIRSMLLNRNDAEDVFQETCLALWKNFADFTPGTSFPAWAAQIARHRVLAFCKKRGRNAESFDEEVLAALAHDLEARGEVLLERQRALEDCLKKMRSIDRGLFERRYRDGLSIVELAAALNRPLNTLYKAMQRIRRSLRACVERTLSGERGLQ